MAQGANVPHNYGRETNHDPDRVWNSTGKYLWDQVMADAGMKFDSIGWEDLEGGNSIAVMRAFVESCRVKPPMQRNGNDPYDSNTVVKAFSTGMLKLKLKFEAQIQQFPGDYFPEEYANECKSLLKKNRSRNLMEGDDDTDLFKGLYPLPCKHSISTMFSPL